MEDILNGTQARPAFMDALDTVAELANVGAQETDLIMIKEKAILAPLSGAEEQVLKSGNVSLNTFIKNFNKILYEKIINKEETSFTDYETFLKLLTPQDKALLIFALSLSSFQNLGVSGIKCEKCGHEYPVDIIPEELWHEDSAPKPWDKEVSPFEYSEFQEFLNGKLKFELGVPTEYARIQLMDTMEKNGLGNPEGEEDTGIFKIIDTVAFFLKSIQIEDKEGNIKKLTDLEKEIFPFLHNLPAKVKDIIFEGIDLTIFDDYMPKLYQESKCTSCFHVNKLPVSIERDFFRKALLSF